MKKSLIIILIVLALATILRIVSTLRPTQQVIQDTPEDPLGILPFDSGVTGKVLLGPICPVVQNPADSKCDDKPYQTTVSIRRLDSSSIFASLKSDENGIFKFSLPPGSYVVIAEGGEKLPRCTEASVIVLPDEYKTVVISCDTGIR